MHDKLGGCFGEVARKAPKAKKCRRRRLLFRLRPPPIRPFCVVAEKEKNRKRKTEGQKTNKHGRKQGSKEESKKARKEERKKGKKKKRGLEFLSSCVLSFVCSLLFAFFCLLSSVRSLLFALFFVCSLLFSLFCLLSFLLPYFAAPPFPPFALVCSRLPPPLVFSSSLWFILKILSFLAADNAGFAKILTNFHFCAVRIGHKSVRDKK